MERIQAVKWRKRKPRVENVEVGENTEKLERFMNTHLSENPVNTQIVEKSDGRKRKKSYKK